MLLDGSNANSSLLSYQPPADIALEDSDLTQQLVMVELKKMLLAPIDQSHQLLFASESLQHWLIRYALRQAHCWSVVAHSAQTTADQNRETSTLQLDICKALSQGMCFAAQNFTKR